ncbi:AGE family epimerase/isomerase [Cohnella caldifontis]|uniref:AGE family epimerase/isomerase n=1 Tax=Cohnella caldifontis TaxID=3027471 RepID=UPI0023EBC9BA|nr:AGE family epimerase/isomerase [Cohnella sp. YIM B05605]
MIDRKEAAARWRAELDAELKRILDFWIQQTPDEEYGGFVGEIRGDGTRTAGAEKGVVLNARILWTFSSAYRIRGENVYLAMAERAYQALDERFRDRVHGGLFWTVDEAGRPVRDKKQVYGQAFAIYALSEYVRASAPRAGEALEWAKQLYLLLEKHAYDPVHLGYVEALARDWTETEDFSLSGKDLNERKSMNTHLHVLEAYTNLYRVWKPAGLRARLTELIDVHLDRILDPAAFRFRLFFDGEWNAKSGPISYGHDIEGSWLLCEAAETLGDEARIERVDRAAVAMAEAALAEGVDPDGGMRNESGVDGHGDDAKDWWPQAEAMVGFLNAFRLSGDGRFWDAALASWRFIERYVVDRENGEWFWQVSREGIPNRALPKAGLWKCPYHNSRACMEAMERLSRYS